MRSRYTYAHLVLGLACALSAAGLTASPVPAQTTTSHTSAEEATATTPPAEQPEPIGPIAAADIATRATETSTQLREIHQALSPTTAVAGIEEGLPVLQQEIAQMEAKPESLQPEDHTVRSLEEVRRQWLHYGSQLTERQKILETRSQALDSQRRDLDSVRETWQLTHDSTQEQELPPAVVERIDKVLLDITTVQTELRERVNYVLTLQNTIAEMGLQISGAMDRIETALEINRRHIFSLEQPPLWEALFSSRDDTITDTKFVDSWQRVISGIRDFFKNYRNEIIFHLALFIALSLFALLLHHRNRGRSFKEESLQITLDILARPVAASYIVSVLLTGILYPNAPIVIYDLAAILVIPALARLIPVLLPQKIRKPVYGLFLLYFLAHLYDLIVGQDLLQRLLLLLLTALALLGLVRTMRSGGPFASLSHAGWQRVRWLAIRLGGPLLGFSLVWNILGGVTLAETLAWAFLYSSFLGVLVYAAVRVFEALIALSLRSRAAHSLNSIRLHYRALQQRIVRLAQITLTVLWLNATLKLFQIQEPVVTALTSFLRDPLVLGNFKISLLNIILFVVILWVTSLLSRIVRYLLKDDILPRAHLTRGLSSTVSLLANYVVMGVGILLAFAAAGLQAGQLTILAGALGVGIGFGLQNIINNFVSGLILIFERPVQIGDTIEVGTLMGKVTRIGIRASTVRTFQGAEVIVPNGNLISNEVVNWTLSDQLRRLEIQVGVAYGTDPQTVLDLLVEVAKSHESVLDTPEPFALFQGFGDSSLDFVLRCWTGDFENWVTVDSEVTVAVHGALAKAGIEIPFPQQDLHVRSLDPSVSAAFEKKGDS